VIGTYEVEVDWWHVINSSWGVGVSRTECRFERQVAADGSTAGVVGHHSSVDVLISVEEECWHRHVYLDIKK